MSDLLKKHLKDRFSCQYFVIIKCLNTLFFVSFLHLGKCPFPSRTVKQLFRHLTLCLTVSSADTLANSFDIDQARQIVGPDQGPNCLTL